MHWTLDQTLAVPADVYDELVTWLSEQNKTKPDGD